MNRLEVHTQFADRFAETNESQKIPSIEDIQQLEVRLGTIFPASYVQFITQIGPIFTPTLLDLVTGGESEEAPEGASFEVQNFFDLPEIEEAAKAYWAAGMDKSLIPFASDSMGNLFGFLRRIEPQRIDDLPLHIFDHDFDTIEEEQISFDGWLESFIIMHNQTKVEQGSAHQPTTR